MMEYINKNRKLGLSGLMRVMNDGQTLAASIDSCVEALDELIITYNDCTDDSPQIIEQKKRQYPDKIIVIPYPYHVMGVNLTDEEYEYVKTLPDDSPHLLASYYNNALKHVNYKYVVKIDADQIYFTHKLLGLRNKIINGVRQNVIEKICGKIVNDIYCLRSGNRRIWSKYHPIHYMQYLVVPLFRKHYINYAISQFIKGNNYLSLSGINVLEHQGALLTPIGCKSKSGVYWPYNGENDTLIFEANEQTYYVPWDLDSYISNSGHHTYIERFVHPKKPISLMGLFWWHLKCMKEPLRSELIDYQISKDQSSLVPVTDLRDLSFADILKKVNEDNNKRCVFNFVHNLDKSHIEQYSQDWQLKSKEPSAE